MGAPPPKELAHLQVHVGVVSNSDLRVPAILRSLGVQVAGRRYGSVVAIDPEGTCDIDSVTMSYDVGVEKPHKMIFGAARSLSGFAAKTDCLCLHVGDDIKDDYGGAHEAGWQSFLLDRDGKHDGRIPEANRLRDLGALMQKLTDAE